MSQVVIVSKKTTLQRIEDDPLRDSGDIPEGIRRSHQRHQKCLADLVAALESNGIRPWVLEGAPDGDVLGDVSFVVSVGGDGTLLRASHFVPDTVPLIAINSDPVGSVGHLCQFLPSDLEKVVHVIRSSSFLYHRTTRMEARINDRVVHRRVLNEALFSHACPAAMTRFSLAVNHGTKREYRSSGVWIGTGAGSTGALGSAGGTPQDLWCPFLQAVVREPYRPPPKDDPVMVAPYFWLESKTDQAILYVDGPYLKVPVRYGEHVSFQEGEPLQLIANK